MTYLNFSFCMEQPETDEPLSGVRHRETGSAAIHTARIEEIPA